MNHFIENKGIYFEKHVKTNHQVFLFTSSHVLLLVQLNNCESEDGREVCPAHPTFLLCNTVGLTWILWFEETVSFRRNSSTNNRKLMAFLVFYGVAVSGVSISCLIIAHLESVVRVIRSGVT
jgi:hypothetical protein